MTSVAWPKVLALALVAVALVLALRRAEPYSDSSGCSPGFGAKCSAINVALNSLDRRACVLRPQCAARLRGYNCSPKFGTTCNNPLRDRKGTTACVQEPCRSLYTKALQEGATFVPSTA